jgi:hypothetical protein
MWKRNRRPKTWPRKITRMRAVNEFPRGARAIHRPDRKPVIVHGIAGPNMYWVRYEADPDMEPMITPGDNLAPPGGSLMIKY